MIDLNHQYALLEDGTIEPLCYQFDDRTEPRYTEEKDGNLVLIHDVPFLYEGAFAWGMVDTKIIATADDRATLEAMPEYRPNADRYTRHDPKSEKEFIEQIKGERQ